jgi:hypothetical protein
VPIHRRVTVMTVASLRLIGPDPQDRAMSPGRSSRDSQLAKGVNVHEATGKPNNLYIGNETGNVHINGT